MVALGHPPIYHLPFPLTEAVVVVWVEDRNDFLTSLVYSVLTCSDHGGLFLFSLVQVLDTPESNLSFAVFDFVRIDTAFFQDAGKLVEMLQW